jgi:hypothetical protein
MICRSESHYAYWPGLNVRYAAWSRHTVDARSLAFGLVGWGAGECVRREETPGSGRIVGPRFRLFARELGGEVRLLAI